MTIFVNGERVDCGDARTLEEFIQHHQLQAETTLVEHNGVALRRVEWLSKRLRENDRVEVLRVAAGG
jgi:thiamine biosynthesis protein ThiS